MNSIDLNKNRNDFLFLPLGGSGEVTMNCNLYHYKGKWLIVDMGISFVKNLPGIDVMLPDITFIKKNIKNFIGIFVTHVHEDHIGAIQYLWDEIKLPIYASKFAIMFLKSKLANYEWCKKVKFIEIPTNGIVTINPFIIEFINLTHSIPEMNAIFIRTDNVNVLHTGDWRFEEKPIIGNPINKQRLEKLGNEGMVSAMICESTNIFVDKENRNEEELLESLKKIINENQQGLVVCSIFATNISRIISIAIAAKSCKRKIGIIGNSIYRTLKVATEMKYIPRDMTFITEDEFNKYDRKKLLLIVTGCQGQENSGLGRLANGSYQNIKLQKDDTVIFSASEIPGNEIEINSLYNKLANLGVKIINKRNAFVHLSGHYTKNELIEMYKLVKPQTAITVHGESMQLIEHKKIAEELGIRSAVRGEDGTILRITPAGIDTLYKIKTINSVVDGSRIILSNSDILRERIKLSDAGIIIVSMVVDRNYKLTSPIDISAVGNYNIISEKFIQESLKEKATNSYKESYSFINNPENKEIFSIDKQKELKIEKDIKKSIENFVLQNMKKIPFVIIKMLKETKDLIKLSNNNMDGVKNESGSSKR